jgi:hypothetical protein
LAIFKRAFCCCLPSCDRTVKYKPIPQEAGATLEGTTRQFERNTCGVCCIAPSVIIGSPFIPASEALRTFLDILSGLVITTTAGTNTYVFSGDIGVVPNGRGNLIVQGGIRVDAISTIKKAFDQMAERLKTKWQNAASEDKDAVYDQCVQISEEERWDYMFESIIKCGLTQSAVEEILAPFSLAITSILDEREETINFIVDPLMKV